MRQVGDKDIDVVLGTQRKTVNRITFNLYGDLAIRTALDKITGPLRKADIERIAVRKNGSEQASIEKSEAEYFEAEPLQLEPTTGELQGERETTLVISKLSFNEGSTWTFFERGATVVAKIEDDEFWQNVHLHEISFGEGDQLRVRLAWKIEERHHQLKQKNTIVKVLDKTEFPQQMGLDGQRTNSPRRRIRTDKKKR